MASLSRRSFALFLFLLAAANSSRADPGNPYAHIPGFGNETRGGIGGRIIRVTTLDSHGPASLRAAVAERGPRIVVFEVGGVIDLDMKGLRISEPYLTIAGQTAPSPGITLIRAGVAISTHDVVIEHLRVRPGDAGQPKRSGWEPDGISTSGADAYNILIDHCSISWAVDENLSASGPRTEGPLATSRKITFNQCIIAEALDDSSHAKGPHSKGSLIHDYCTEIAIIGCFYAHNAQRNPYFKAFCTGAIVNNLIYNPRGIAIQLNYVESEWEGVGTVPGNPRVSIVGNVFIHGADTRKNLPLVTRRGDAYLSDNRAMDRDGADVPLARGEIRLLAENPVWPAGLEPLPAESVIDHVLHNSGARPRDRDAVDSRIIEDFRARRGRIIDSQNDVGGYPQPNPTHRRFSIPGDDVSGWLRALSAELE